MIILSAVRKGNYRKSERLTGKRSGGLLNKGILIV